MKTLLYIPVVSVIILIAFLLYRSSGSQSTYAGLPVVPCIDSTKPLVQSFSLKINISVNDKNYPLNEHIGFDPGKCQRSIFTLDGSGKVYVKSNEANQYTLGDFFNVWHKTFDLGGKYQIKVLVNGVPVSTLDKIPLKSNQIISISYN